MARKSRISLISFIGLIFVLMCSLVFSFPALAAAGDETTPGTITVIPTFECIGVRASYTGDNNQNNSAILQYRQSGGTWKTAPEMFADRANHEYRGSIFWLTPRTQYEVKVTFNDTDGGGSLSTTTSTRDDEPAIGTHYIYASLSGNDTTGNGSESNPYRSLQKANNVAVATPGSTVVLRGGTWSESMTMQRGTGGSPSAWLTFMAYPGETVIFDGHNGSIANAFYLYYPSGYIRIKGIQFQNFGNAAILGRTCHDIIIEDCVFTNNNIKNTDPDVGNIMFENGDAADICTYYITIQHNIITMHTTPDMAPGQSGVADGIGLWTGSTVAGGYGNVIRYNTITSPNYTLRDGIGTQPQSGSQSFVANESSDYYGNVVSGCADDMISVEGGDINMRMWGNECKDGLSGIGECPVSIGPAYIFRNQVSNFQDTCVKQGGGQNGRVYLYHNSFYSNQSTADGYLKASSGLNNSVVSINNIIYVGRYIFESGGAAYPGSFNYDYMYTTDPTRWGKFDSTGVHSLAEFQGSPWFQEIHGIYNSDMPFIDPANGDLTLKANSLCVDAGTILPGFNDANSPWPYNGSAPDIGDYEFGSGGPTNHPPVLAPIGNKTVPEGSTLQFTVSATDPDGGKLTYSASNLPLGASFNDPPRVFKWTPTSEQVGTYNNLRFQVTDVTNRTDFENISITVKEASANPSSGGNGGGGGGGGGGGSGATSLLDSMNGDGKIVTEVLATSADQKVRLIIPRNTYVKNAEGEKVNVITIKPSIEQTGPCDGARELGECYDIKPSGTIFDPSATLVFEYEAAALPEGIAENQLFIALWDPAAGEWTDLGGAIDTAANTVTVVINHLSTYALMAHTRPASFEVTSLSVTPAEVSPDQDVSVSAAVVNNGDFSGSYTLDLMLDNVPVASKSLELPGRESATVVFTISSSVIGEHQINVGSVSSLFTVKATQSPASFTASELKINPLSVYHGEDIIISILVTNTGESRGSYQAHLEIDGTDFQTKGVTLDAGAAETISFDVTLDGVGVHRVNVDGLAGLCEVKPLLAPSLDEKPRLELQGYSVTPVYNEATKKLVFARIVYQMNQDCQSEPDARLMLTVFHDGEFIEQIPALSMGQISSDGKTGEFNYIPLPGWRAGEYTFYAELYKGNSLVQKSQQQNMIVTPEAITKIASWWTLGTVIGVASILILILVGVIIYRKRDMLKE
jgi:hypothetical protein